MDTLFLRHLYIVGLLSGLLAVVISATPQGKALEENLGLLFLFKVRGHRPPPGNVVILAIEKQSAEFFGLKQQPYKWPRSIHSKAVNRLTEMNVAAVGFDMFFEETRSLRDDQLFAEALKSSGRVALLQRLKRVSSFSDNFTNDHRNIYSGVNSEQFIPPVPLLEQAALALAPLPLPQNPVRVNQTWLFKEGTGNRASLPVIMFAITLSPLLDNFVELVKLADPSLIIKYKTLFSKQVPPRRLDSIIQDWRSVFLVEDTLRNKMIKLLQKKRWETRLSKSEKKKIVTLVNILGGKHSAFINYYGPPGTITTLPYSSLFHDSTENRVSYLSQRAVFIGLTHEAEMGEKDGFYTVFTTKKGKHISGVEVAASLFANLEDGSFLIPLHSFIAIICIAAMGLVTAALGHTLNPLTACVATLTLGLVYLTAAYTLFAKLYIWSPVAIPILFQIPLTYVTITLLKYRRTSKARKNFQKALQCYIPENIIHQIEHDFSRIAGNREISAGICLFSDIENYTVLSENADQQKLSKLINNYYEQMFQIVKLHSGIILDIRGDAMLALWPNHDQKEDQVEQACLAAYSISRIFNNPESRTEHHLPTRIGLHQGSLSLGNIGTFEHFQYTITGDTVNTTARIESLNKQLGTKLLVSEYLVKQHLDLRFRKIGRFLFVGKSQPLSIYEPIGINYSDNDLEDSVTKIFTMGRKRLERGQLQKRLELLQEGTSLSPEYGPALWFQKLCKDNIANPTQLNNDGVIRLASK